MSVQSDCLIDDNMAGSEKKSEFKSLAASHLANLPKYTAVKIHWIATFFFFFASPAIKTVYLFLRHSEDFEISARTPSLGTRCCPPHSQLMVPSPHQPAIFPKEWCHYTFRVSLRHSAHPALFKLLEMHRLFVTHRSCPLVPQGGQKFIAAGLAAQPPPCSRSIISCCLN